MNSFTSGHWLCDRLVDWLADYEAGQDHSDQRMQSGLYRRELGVAGKAQTLEWARSVEIVVQPIPANVWRQASLYFRHRPSPAGLEAHVRHQFTNYDHLLAELRRRRGAAEAYKVLRVRADEAVRQALKGISHTA